MIFKIIFFILILNKSIFKTYSLKGISSWVNLYIFFVDKMELDIAIQKYIKYRLYVQKLAKSWVINDRGALERFNQYLFTKYSKILDLNEIKFDDFIDYSEFLATAEFRRWRSQWKKIKLSHNSRVNHQRKIRLFFKRCYQNKFMNIDFRDIQIWNIKRRENASILSHDEIKQFFEFASQWKHRLTAVRDELLFRLAYYTWLRRNEILNLTFEQLLCDNQFQIIGKLDRSRTVYFDDESKIKELALELKYLYSKEFKSDYSSENDFVFRSTSSSNHWEQLWRWMIYLILLKYKKKIWIDPKRRLTLHSFRHTFATTLLENWANLREVQLLLWHASLKTTAFYTHISTTRLRACSSLLHLS